MWGQLESGITQTNFGSFQKEKVPDQKVPEKEWKHKHQQEDKRTWWDENIPQN